MAEQDFETIREPLLPLLERVVLADHAALHRDVLGEPWSLPAAYRWMRYESPDPVGRLIDATHRLTSKWEQAGAGAADRSAGAAADLLEQALAAARRLGYPG